MKKHLPNICMGLVVNIVLAVWIVWSLKLNAYTLFRIQRLALWNLIGVVLWLLVAAVGKRWSLTTAITVAVVAFCYGLSSGWGNIVVRVGSWFVPANGAIAIAWVVSGTAGLLIDGEKRRLFWQSATWALLLVLAFASELGFALWRAHMNS